MKHLPIPPVAFGNGPKCVYVYGDPILAAISLFRRGFHHAQSVKLLRYARPHVDPIPAEQSLEEYAAAGVDRFLFHRHYHNWRSKYPILPTLFVRYDELWANIPALLKFLELSEELTAGFPPRRARESLIEDIDASTAKSLNKMYGGLARELAGRPAVEFRQGSTSRAQWRFFRGTEYRQAWKSHLSFTARVELHRRAPRLHSFLKHMAGGS